MEQPNPKPVADRLKEVRSIMTHFTDHYGIGSALFYAGYRHLEGRADAIMTLCEDLITKLNIEIVCLEDN